MDARRRVYLNEYNVLMPGTAYLPLVSGKLAAFARTRPAVREAFRFEPCLFLRRRPAEIRDAHERPAVAAFSTFLWNERLNLKAAEMVKRRFPGCLIVFGGPQVPWEAEDYFRRHPFLDVAVRGEGEVAFSDILERFSASLDFSGLAGVSWRHRASGKCISNDGERVLCTDLDTFPSPYLEGLFDEAMARHREMEFQAIIETGRGCPFRCTYCAWYKGGSSRGQRLYSLERVAAEIDWCGVHRVRYLFNADANFGIHRRDARIAEMLVAAKEKYGYPEKFRACFTKTATPRICDIGELLYRHGLEKGVTLSLQSLNAKVQANIRRRNIRPPVYRNLLSRLNRSGVPVYTELILGLPGETPGSWVRGIEKVMASGLQGQLFIYPCEVYPNTEIAEPAYRERFGIVTRRILLTETHGVPRGRGIPAEYQEIIVGTDSMPLEDWRRMMLFSWLTMLLHSLKAGFFLLRYLFRRWRLAHTDFIGYVLEHSAGPLRGEIAFLEGHLGRILAGEGRGIILPRFGPIYWDPEEAVYLRLSGKMDRFFDEMRELLDGYLRSKGIVPDQAELGELLAYQQALIPTPYLLGRVARTFHYGFPEYFHLLATTGAGLLRRSGQTLAVHHVDYGRDAVRFAREVVLWGRKSNGMLNRAEWSPAR